MKYNTTSLSAITLCVCMMLSRHTNGMDMRGTPSSFNNGNLNQMPMAGQPWNQQPNTNMQFGSNNWNNVVGSTLPVLPSNPQPPEEITLGTTVDQGAKHIYIHFPKKYNPEPMQWQASSHTLRFHKKVQWNNKDAFIACYKGDDYYVNAKRFYDYVDRIADPFQKRKLNTILFKRIANGQTADKKKGCLVFELPPNYENFQTFIRRMSTFASIKQLPSIVARIMDAITTLNEIGVVYNSIVADHIWIAENAMGRVYDIKLFYFDRSITYEDFKRLKVNPNSSPTSKLTAIYKSFIIDVRHTSKFIASLLPNYEAKLVKDFTPDPTITPSELEKHNEKRKALEALMKEMAEANPPLMMMNFQLTAQYNLISEKYD